jgi:hypothetical protein
LKKQKIKFETQPDSSKVEKSLLQNHYFAGFTFFSTRAREREREKRERERGGEWVSERDESVENAFVSGQMRERVSERDRESEGEREREKGRGGEKEYSAFTFFTSL